MGHGEDGHAVRVEQDDRRKGAVDPAMDDRGDQEVSRCSGE